MELFLCKSSTCYHHGQFDAYRRQSVYIHRHQALQVLSSSDHNTKLKIVRSDIVFARSRAANASESLPFPFRLQCHLVRIEQLLCTCMYEGRALSPESTFARAAVFIVTIGTQKKRLFIRTVQLGSDTSWKHYQGLCCCQRDSVMSTYGFEESPAAARTHIDLPSGKFTQDTGPLTQTVRDDLCTASSSLIICRKQTWQCVWVAVCVIM